MAIEGVDFSRTAGAGSPSVAALKAAGKYFAGRYAVNDKSPLGRGITAAEYKRYVAGGFDVFLFWQTTTDWMLGGFAAGQAGAVNAQQNIAGAGMPLEMPVYFACDFDATEAQQAQIDECLRGAASVLGLDRVGLYAGRWPLMRSMANKSAAWFCQTTAWSGGVIVPGIHLYQYDYNKFIDGTNVDFVRAYQDHYGQASDFTGPAYAKPAPISWKQGDTGIKDLNGTPALAFVLQLRVTDGRGVQPVAHSGADAPATGPIIPFDTRVTAIGAYRGGPHRIGYVVLSDGSRVVRSKLRPLAPLPPKEG